MAWRSKCAVITFICRINKRFSEELSVKLSLFGLATPQQCALGAVAAIAAAYTCKCAKDVYTNRQYLYDKVKFGFLGKRPALVVGDGPEEQLADEAGQPEPYTVDQILEASLSKVEAGIHNELAEVLVYGVSADAIQKGMKALAKDSYIKNNYTLVSLDGKRLNDASTDETEELSRYLAIALEKKPIVLLLSNGDSLRNKEVERMLECFESDANQNSANRRFLLVMHTELSKPALEVIVDAVLEEHDGASSTSKEPQHEDEAASDGLFSAAEREIAQE